jgi:hypothetical protein
MDAIERLLILLSDDGVVIGAGEDVGGGNGKFIRGDVAVLIGVEDSFGDEVFITFMNGDDETEVAVGDCILLLLLLTEAFESGDVTSLC